jgi:hypothetical protein
MSDNTLMALLALMGTLFFGALIYTAVVQDMATKGQCGTPFRVEACKCR